MQGGEAAGLGEELGEQQVAVRVVAELAVEEGEAGVVDEGALPGGAEEELEDGVGSAGGDGAEVRAGC